MHFLRITRVSLTSCPSGASDNVASSTGQITSVFEEEGVSTCLIFERHPGGSYRFRPSGRKLSTPSATTTPEADDVQGLFTFIPRHVFLTG